MQTIYAVLALSVAMLFTLSMQANIVSRHERNILNEYEVMAGSVAIAQLERLELEDYGDLFSFQTVTPDTLQFEIEDLSVPFLVNVNVAYVDENGNPSALTDYTLVRIEITSEWMTKLRLRQERVYKP